MTIACSVRVPTAISMTSRWNGLVGRATWPPGLRTVVLLGDESPVPTQDGVGSHDARDSREVTTAEDVALHGETASLVVGQAQSSGTVHRAEDAVLLEQVVNDRLLVSIDPAREQQEEEGKRGRQPVHGGSLPERRAPCNGCEIGHPAPSDWAAIPEANAPSDGVDRPVSRRCALGVCAAENGTIFQMATLPQEPRSTVGEGSKYPRNRAKSVLPRRLLGWVFAQHGDSRTSKPRHAVLNVSEIT